jgi:hypothetical protein
MRVIVARPNFFIHSKCKKASLGAVVASRSLAHGARMRRGQCFALLRVISNQVRNVRARLRDFVVQHAPQNVAPNGTRHREANRNCRHLVPGQAVFQVFPDLFFGHNTFLLQYSTGSSQASFVQNLAKIAIQRNNLSNISKNSDAEWQYICKNLLANI